MPTNHQLRASEIPQMVDVDGYIDQSLLRTIGCQPRQMAEVIEPEFIDQDSAGDWWEAGSDVYQWSAADEWLPQPPAHLAPWERRLHGLRPASLREMVGALVFIPSVRDPRGPTRDELSRGVELGRLTQLAESVGLNLHQWQARWLASAFAATAVREAMESERVAEQIRVSFRVDTTPITQQIARLEAEVARLRVARSWVDDLVIGRPPGRRRHQGPGPLPIDGAAYARRRNGRRGRR